MANYKTLLDGIKNTNTRKDVSCSWLGKLNIVKMSTVPKVIYKFRAIPSEISIAFFAEMGKTILKFL